MAQRFSFYEFFAGGGMARLGLGSRWNCLVANDIDEKKAAAYAQNFRDSAKHLIVRDICEIRTQDLPRGATLSWASFPCQDLSLAGNYKGIRAERSGVFWPFWELMLGLRQEGRQVPLVVIENVAGLLTSKNGRDFEDLISTVIAAGYRTGGLVIDAAHFLPQSRPRLFIVCVKNDVAIPEDLLTDQPMPLWHTRSMVSNVMSWPKKQRDSWLWWKLPVPEGHALTLGDLVEDEPNGVAWHTKAATKKVLGMMSDVNRDKVGQAQKAGQKMVGAIYKRTRQDLQRAEVRFDGMSGCLRTPAGGSSRQTIIVVEGRKVRTRLLSPREAARLMGVKDSYKLPERYNDAYKLMGDGLAVPAVSWLEQNILFQLAKALEREAAEVA